jgi:hypothetical protein
MCIPRSWTNGDGEAAMREFLRQRPPRRAAMRDLICELKSSEPFMRRCAADLARRVSARAPGILRQHAGVLIDLAAGLGDEEWQARGYAAVAAALNAATHTERMRLAGLLRPMLKDKRIAVQAMALEAFATVAVVEPRLRAAAIPLLEGALREGRCARQLRARRMLPLLLAAGGDAGKRSH